MLNKLKFLKSCLDKGAHYLTESDDEYLYYNSKETVKMKERKEMINLLEQTKYLLQQGEADVFLPIHKKMLTNSDHQLIFSKKWCTGGADGGNCWGDDAQQFDGDPEPDDYPEFEEWKKENYPQYKSYEIINQLKIGSHSYTENEYYGNYRDYHTSYFFISELFYVLKEMEAKPKKNLKI